MKYQRNFQVYCDPTSNGVYLKNLKISNVLCILDIMFQGKQNYSLH